MSRITIFTTYYEPLGSPLVAAARFRNIKVSTFGTDGLFVSFYDTKILGQRKFLESVNTPYSCFIDGSDAFVVSPVEEIIDKYRSLANDRIVVGSERFLWPYRWAADMFEQRYGGRRFDNRYLDTGFIMARTETFIGLLDAIIENFERWCNELKEHPRHILRDDVGLWTLAIRDGLFDPYQDYGNDFCVALRNYSPEHISIRGRRVLVKTNAGVPCVVHCNGHRHKDRHRLGKFYRACFGLPYSGVKVPTCKNPG